MAALGRQWNSVLEASGKALEKGTIEATIEGGAEVDKQRRE